MIMHRTKESKERVIDPKYQKNETKLKVNLKQRLKNKVR